MSTTPPPEQPGTGTGGTRPSGGYGMPSITSGARMPVPGNAEWLLWFVVEVLFAIIWAASDSVGAGDFMLGTSIITFAYLISRGIAKAGRVLEH